MPATPCAPCSITASSRSSTRTTRWRPPDQVGDNDNLSARAAILADADLLILLTDQKGLFTADPRTNPDAQLIEEVQTIDDTLRKLAGDSVSGLGTGGMAASCRPRTWRAAPASTW